jgi:hypothetical protein
MTEIKKLSVGTVLDKLRRPNPPKDRLAQVDDKIEAARAEARRLRSERHRLASPTLQPDKNK